MKLRLQQQALSLFEALLTLTLLISLMLLTIPSFTAVCQQVQQYIAATHFSQLCRTARTMAIASQQTAVICGSRHGDVCDGQWHRGVLLIYTRDATRHHHTLAWPGRLSGNVRYNQLAVNPQRLTFLTDGSVTSNGRIQLLGRELVLSRTGRLRYQ